MTTIAPQRETFYTYRLPNGLQLLGQYMPDVQSVSACFYVVTGSRDEEPGVAGVSHFLEHMTFKGTPTRSYDQINKEFEEMGAENNAGTSIEQTYFWAKVLRDQTPALIGLLADMMHPCLDSDDFGQERNVILEEIARYEDMPGSILFRHLLETYFGSHPISHSVLGSKESIGGMTIEQMRAYWDRRYAANNMIFSIAGNFDWDTVRSQVESLCDHWRQGEAGRTAGPATAQSRTLVVHREPMAQQMIGWAIPGVPDGDPDRYVAEVLGTVLGDSTGSRLFWGVREAGLVEDIGADFWPLDGAGILIVSASTEPAQTGAALAAIHREIATLQRDGVQAAELERAKTKLSSRLVMDGESTNRRMLSLVGSWLTLGRLETLEEIEAAIERVSMEDCRRFLDRVPLTETQVVVTLGPLTEEEFQAQLTGATAAP